MRIALNVVAGVPSKSVQDLGFEEEPLSNENILDKHWSAFRKCDSQKKFNAQLNHLIFGPPQSHSFPGYPDFGHVRTTCQTPI